MPVKFSGGGKLILASYIYNILLRHFPDSWQPRSNGKPQLSQEVPEHLWSCSKGQGEQMGFGRCVSSGLKAAEVRENYTHGRKTEY